MDNKMKKFLILTLASLLGVAFAQELVDVISPFSNYNYVVQAENAGDIEYNYRSSALNSYSALASAIGNATVASGQMVPQFTSNPANLAMTRYSSLHVSGLFNNYNGVNKNSLGGINYIVSVPVYSGSMTYSAGVQRIKDYNLYYQDDKILQRTNGGLYNWHIGGALEALEDIYVGADVSVLSGKKNNDMEFKIPANPAGYYEETSYFGATARVGVNYHILPILNVAASMDLPTIMDVDYAFRLYDSNSSQSINYDIKTPAVFRAGFAVTLKIVDLYYSYNYTNWQNTSVKSNEMLLTDLDDLNSDITGNLGVVGSHHIGMAFHVPLIPLHLYMGYQYLPDVHSGLNTFSLGNLIPNELNDDFTSSFSWGASFFLKQGISVSASFETYNSYFDKTDNGIDDGDIEKPKSMNLSMAYYF